MKKRILLLAVLGAIVLAGCQEDRVSDDSKPAPAPKYKMVPAESSPKQ